ncbi:MAG: formylglycine-generating enzyme family protein [Lentisphaerae bacterium]|jgi:formylglycine-generating enzyme|nr:formylglycine-generating enzyme family protein [Lentisphaerota bacterium]MBT4817830.1 formylglycine-generating enzyme family protein [Lentisphaerota bacterium]MBT5607374.1 formylglycine-generating enzyme family protein [Lentisphaerota bacterium]MBT7058384.1 formylglycine-generating enzyme family protein [Lentisphaerota bacterium]MBT7841701.1 formylglycine-generating enzyme family protein [Lentisphaerota bacterium]
MTTARSVLLTTALMILATHVTSALVVTDAVHSPSRDGTTLTVSGSFSFTGTETFTLVYALPEGWAYIDSSGTASSGSPAFAFNDGGNELSCFLLGTPSSPLSFSFDVGLPSHDATGTVSGEIQYNDAQGNPQPAIPIGSALSFPIYTLTVENGTGDGQYEPGTAVTVAADTPPAGHHFAGWAAPGGAGTFTDASLPSTTYTTSANDVTVTGTYAINTYALDVASDHGTPTPAVDSHTYDWGTDITCSVTSPEEDGTTRYVCSGWTGTGNVPAAGTALTTGNLTITEGSSITWNWDTEYWLDTEVIGNGAVDVADDWKPANASVTIAATPAANHHFTGWSGAVEGATINGTQITVTMSEARAITASFAIDTYDVTFHAGAHGVLAGGNPDVVFTVNHGDPAPVAPAVTPDATYEFIDWSPVLPGIVTATVATTAHYALDYHDADYLTGGDWKIDPLEVTRLIEFYKANGYHSDPNSADGFAPGPGDQSGAMHSADYLSGGNWKIDPQEVTRVIEFYKANAYHWDDSAADGYAQGEPPPPAEFALIEAGTNSGTDPDFGTYSLTVDTFYMAKTEVPKAKWDDVRAWGLTNGYTDLPEGGGEGPDHPVQEVSWSDVVKWCNARSEMEERTPCYTDSGVVYRTGEGTAGTFGVACDSAVNGYRLPTDIEWEYAARGGLSGKRFPWGDTITHSQANYLSDEDFDYDVSLTRGHHPTYDDGTVPYTSPVGSFPANGYGLHDVTGNVWEWCWDWYPGYVGSLRVYRGGGWNRNATGCRVASNDGYGPTLDYDSVGFRVCSTAPGE